MQDSSMFSEARSWHDKVMSFTEKKWRQLLEIRSICPAGQLQVLFDHTGILEAHRMCSVSMGIRNADKENVEVMMSVHLGELN